MCGIVGAIGYSQERIERALDTMQDRGPDDFGTWCNQPVVFGHRRLSILDLTINGRQPMTDASGQIVITFNGEIYNYQELRKELETSYPFRTNTDTEVLIAGYLQWGIEELLKRIRGMFAFAIWDERIDRLTLARDPFGKKPLFYHRQNNRFVFASTINALLAVLDSTPPVSARAIDDYLTYLAVPGEQSIFEGVHKLLPGHFAVLENGTLSLKRYWFLSFANPIQIREEEALDELNRLLRQAVRRRLVSDVPIGAFLSGGVDSSLVTALMAEESGRQITTLTMGFEETEFDERPYARIVSNKYRTKSVESVLHKELWTNLPRIVQSFGEPFADSSALPTYYVSKFAREHVTVVLNGDGGDELFAGYTRPLVESLAQTYRRWIPQLVRRPIGKYAQSQQRLRPRMLNGMKQVLEAGMTDARSAFVFNRSLRSYRDEIYSENFKRQLGTHHPDEWYQKIWDEGDGDNPVDKALYGDAMTYLPDELLPKMDSMTMAHSLEGRSPLLDTDLAEFTARLPYHLKVQGLDTKVLLKKLASRYVPHEVLYRPKKGFNMPLATWLRTVLAGPLHELLCGSKALERGLFEPKFIRGMLESHLAGSRDYAQPLWSLMMIELWFRMYIDKDISARDELHEVVGGVYV